MSKDLSSILETEKLLKENNANLKKIATSIRKHAMLVGFTQKILKDFIANGNVSNQELLKLYHGDGLREEFAAIKPDSRPMTLTMPMPLIAALASVCAA